MKTKDKKIFSPGLHQFVIQNDSSIIQFCVIMTIDKSKSG